MTYDCGNYEASLDAALRLADYAGVAQRKAESRARGKLRGIGLSCYIEACGIAPSAAVGALGAGVGLWESAKIRFNPTGNLRLYTGPPSHRPGHQTPLHQPIPPHP